MYRKSVERLLKLYGRKCTIIPYGKNLQIQVKAFINPLLYKAKQYYIGQSLPDGFYDGRSYLYIGEAKVRLDDMPIGSVVKCGNNEYTIKYSEQYYVGGEPLYSWGVLQLLKRSDSVG